MRSKGIEHLLGAPLGERRTPKLTELTRNYARDSLVSRGAVSSRRSRDDRVCAIKRERFGNEAAGCSGIDLSHVDTRLLAPSCGANECAADCISASRAPVDEMALKKEYWQGVLAAIVLAVGIYFLAHGCSKKASADSA